MVENNKDYKNRQLTKDEVENIPKGLFFHQHLNRRERRKLLNKKGSPNK
jgi:hypothetical protein